MAGSQSEQTWKIQCAIRQHQADLRITVIIRDYKVKESPSQPQKWELDLIRVKCSRCV